jgi:lipoprotein-releasing system ATP-binding protein
MNEIIKDNDEILTVTGLEKTYRTEIETLTILKNLEMHVKRGEKCVIVGRSGSGKSTLLNIIGGLDTPTSGTVAVDGKIISSLSEDELTKYRQHFLGLVFQFHYLLKDFTALENIFLPAYMAGVSKKKAQEKALSLLNDVGLADRADHLPSQLSGGERQRVAVARCLINDPELVLADEPTGNLDPANAVLIGDLLFSMADKYKKTLILVTHDMNIASKGDVKYYIQNGMLAEQEPSAGGNV